MIRSILLICCFFCCSLALLTALFFFPDAAHAQKKKRKAAQKKGIQITETSTVFQINGTQCLVLADGAIYAGSQSKDGKRFIKAKPQRKKQKKLKRRRKKLERRMRKARGAKKLRMQAKIDLVIAALLNISPKALTERCTITLGGREPEPDPNATNFDLAPFRGTFGPREARILGERFCFAFTPEEAQQVANEGLDAAIARIQSYRSDARHPSYPGNPLISTLVADAQCDGYLKLENYDDNLNQSVDDPAEEVCNPLDPNDVDMIGVRSRLYLEAMGENCYHAKMAFFLADEFTAPSLAFAGSDSCYRHLAPKYLNDVWEGAISGDYKQYIRKIFDPNQGSGYSSVVLNVVGNRDPQIPNEDGARELLELGTFGYKKLDDTLNYGPLDIIQTALAFTGYIWGEFTRTTGTNSQGELTQTTVCTPSFSSDAHTPGAKPLFQHDPANQAVVEDLTDAVEASLSHSELPVEIAEKICRNFIANHATKCGNSTINLLASWVIAEDYNLNRVMARVMKASALYNGTTDEALIKHPIDKVLGVYRAAKFPLGKEPMSIRDVESKVLDRMGQRAFLPPTIFGFYEEELAAEGRVLDRRRAMYNMWGPDNNDGNFTAQNLSEETGYSIRDRFIAGMPNSLAVVDKVASTFNIELSAMQRGVADRFLNYYVDSNCQSYEVSQGHCTQAQLGQPYERRDVFDPASSAWKYVERVQGLIIMLNQLAQSQTM